MQAALVGKSALEAAQDAIAITRQMIAEDTPLAGAVNNGYYYITNIPGYKRTIDPEDKIIMGNNDTGWNAAPKEIAEQFRIYESAGIFRIEGGLVSSEEIEEMPFHRFISDDGLLYTIGRDLVGTELPNTGYGPLYLTTEGKIYNLRPYQKAWLRRYIQNESDLDTVYHVEGRGFKLVEDGTGLSLHAADGSTVYDLYIKQMNQSLEKINNLKLADLNPGIIDHILLVDNSQRSRSGILNYNNIKTFLPENDPYPRRYDGTPATEYGGGRVNLWNPALEYQKFCYIHFAYNEHNEVRYRSFPEDGAIQIPAEYALMGRGGGVSMNLSRVYNGAPEYTRDNGPGSVRMSDNLNVQRGYNGFYNRMTDAPIGRYYHPLPGVIPPGAAAPVPAAVAANVPMTLFRSLKSFLQTIPVDDTINEEEYCIICMKNKKNVQMIPCNHNIMCSECLLTNGNEHNKFECPLCKDSNPITGLVRFSEEEVQELSSITELNKILENEDIENLRIKMPSGVVFHLRENQKAWFKTYIIGNFSPEIANTTGIIYKLVETDGKLELQSETGTSGYIVKIIEQPQPQPQFTELTISTLQEKLNDEQLDSINIITTDGQVFDLKPIQTDWLNKYKELKFDQDETNSTTGGIIYNLVENIGRLELHSIYGLSGYLVFKNY